VLHPNGGYLEAMLRAYRYLPIFALAGRETMFSWISRRDTVGLIQFALEDDRISGSLNLTAPNPVSHSEFAGLVATALGRRAWGNLPGWALRLGLGDFADAILDSQEILPERALASGFHFADPEIGPYLELVLRGA
jgi:NAD dependent epimerase/dehydratase family enzyme